MASQRRAFLALYGRILTGMSVLSCVHVARVWGTRGCAVHKVCFSSMHQSLSISGCHVACACSNRHLQNVCFVCRLASNACCLCSCAILHCELPVEPLLALPCVDFCSLRPLKSNTSALSFEPFSKQQGHSVKPHCSLSAVADLPVPCIASQSALHPGLGHD